MSVESDLNDTLALVNVARMAFGKDVLTELPDSKPGDSSDCLFYRALSPLGIQSVGGNGEMECKDERQASYLASMWGTRVEGRTVYAPKQFGNTIKRFDNHELGHYDTRESRNFERSF